MFYKCFVQKKKNGSSQLMVSERLALGLVRKADKRKPRVVLESKCNERALGFCVHFKDIMMCLIFLVLCCLCGISLCRQEYAA